MRRGLSKFRYSVVQTGVIREVSPSVLFQATACSQIIHNTAHSFASLIMQAYHPQGRTIKYITRDGSEVVVISDIAYRENAGS